MATTKVPDSPAKNRLAAQWLRLINRESSKEELARKTVTFKHELESWANTLAPALKKYKVEEVREMMKWALWTDTFWPTRVTSPEKVVDFLDTLMNQWRGFKFSTQNKEQTSALAEWKKQCCAVEEHRIRLLVQALAELNKKGEACKAGHVGPTRHIPYFVTGITKRDYCPACQQVAVDLRKKIHAENPLPIFKK